MSPGLRNPGFAPTTGAAAQIESFNARLQQQHDLLKVQERQLRAQNVQLDAALNNIVQGLAMFDADLRVVLGNDALRRSTG